MYDGCEPRLHMSELYEQSPLEALLEALLDSWDRNNTILMNLLRAVPEGGLEARAVEAHGVGG